MRLIVGDLYQGRTEYARSAYGEDITIFRGLDDIVRESLNKGLSEEAIISNLKEKAMTFDVVIAQEGYMGLTPIDEKERRFTEVYGRSLQELAALAESVERVVCGLSVALK